MQNGSAKIVILLLEKGANPNKLTPDGKTPLALAARVRVSQSILIFAVHGSAHFLLISRRMESLELLSSCSTMLQLILLVMATHHWLWLQR